MSKFEIIPYSKAGDISFDSERESVRKIIGEFKEFKKSKFSRNTTDDFKFCHVYYDEHNKINAIEFFQGSQVIYNEKNLMGMSYNELLKFAKDNGFGYEEDDSGVIIDKLGISIFSPDKQRIETLLVYRRGYYD